jgi:hypothetical protein
MFWEPHGLLQRRSQAYASITTRQVRQFIGGTLRFLFLVQKEAWPKGKQWKTIII